MTAGALSAGAARRLAARAPLAVDPARPAALKRNVHEVVVDAEAPAMAQALREVLISPRRVERRPGRGTQA